jgi:hypothetical protein
MRVNRDRVFLEARVTDTPNLGAPVLTVGRTSTGAPTAIVWAGRVWLQAAWSPRSPRTARFLRALTLRYGWPFLPVGEAWRASGGS